jgi:hypothetical protein
MNKLVTLCNKVYDFIFQEISEDELRKLADKEFDWLFQTIDELEVDAYLFMRANFNAVYFSTFRPYFKITPKKIENLDVYIYRKWEKWLMNRFIPSQYGHYSYTDYLNIPNEIAEIRRERCKKH